MVPPFCSIYTKDYRHYEKEPKLEQPRECLYYQDLGENFLSPEDLKPEYNPERDDDIIKKLYKRRLTSVYQKDYCYSMRKKSLAIDAGQIEDDEFIEHFIKYYGKRAQAIPRPLNTARRIFGASRFDYYYTEISTYEDTIGRGGYEFFKNDYDSGISRLYKKKQLEMRRQNELKAQKLKEEEEAANKKEAEEKM